MHLLQLHHKQTMHTQTHLHNAHIFFPPVLILTFRSRCPQLCHVVSPGRARVPLPLPGFFLLPCSAVSALIVSPSSVTAPPAVWEEPTVMDANHFARVPVHPRRLSQQAQPRLSPLLGS